MAVHRLLVQVRSTDLDWLGHVNNTAYPEYVQEARIAFQALWRGGLRHDEVDTIMGRLEIDYARSIEMRETPVAVDTVVEKLGRTSFVYRHEIREPDSDVVYARARSVMVQVDRASGRPAPLIDSLREHLAAYAEDLP